jgi:hypothetical protein
MGELITIAGGALRRGDEEAEKPLPTCGLEGMKAVLSIGDLACICIAAGVWR